MSATDPTAQATAVPTTQPPAQPTEPPARPQAETESAATDGDGGRGHATGPRRLVRRTEDRMVAGVCSGLARHLGLDPNLVRVLAVLAAVLGVGSVVIAYLVAWVLVPRDTELQDTVRQDARVARTPVVAAR